MPSNSYDFKNPDPPVESSSSSKYKPTERSEVPSSTATPLKIKDTNLPKKENNVPSNPLPKSSSSNGRADPDSKWKANYVPTILEGDEFKNVNLYSASQASTAKNSKNDLDAKWRQNYVPTPFDMDKVNIEEGRRTLASTERLIEDAADKRPQWSSKAESVFGLLGYTLGIGNVIRFPMLVYRYGGGAFLLPYVIFLVLVGMPLYFLELGMGQYSQLGPLNVWRCSSVMHGIGIAMVILSLMASIYLNQIMAYSLYYIAAIFAYSSDDLPWTQCGDSWATNNCFELSSNTPLIELATNTSKTSSAVQFLFNKVLHQSVQGTPTDEIGTIRWDLAFCLLLSWVLVFLVIVKGVRSTGKASYFITTLPVLCIIVVLIGGVCMEGASKGLLYLFLPRWHELASFAPWQEALQQVIFSLSLSFGGIIMYGSYNNFRNKVQYDAIAICIADFIMSLLSSVAVFSILGAMAYDLKLDSLDKLPDIKSLAFLSVPSAIATSMPAPHAWAFVFFLALFTLGLSSLGGLMHTLMGAVQDTLPSLRGSTVAVSGVLCASCYLLGLPLCAEERGYFIFQTLERYGVGISVLVVAVLELFAFSWVYGVRRVSEDFSFMLGYAPSMFWKVCWAFLSSVIVLVFVIYGAVTWHDFDLNPATDPSWGPGLRWGFTAISIGFIPLVFLIMIIKRLCSKGKGRLFTPALSWGPGDAGARSQLMAARNAGSNGGIDNPALSLKP